MMETYVFYLSCEACHRSHHHTGHPRRGILHVAEPHNLCGGGSRPQVEISSQLLQPRTRCYHGADELARRLVLALDELQ